MAGETNKDEDRWVVFCVEEGSHIGSSFQTRAEADAAMASHHHETTHHVAAVGGSLLTSPRPIDRIPPRPTIVSGPRHNLDPRDPTLEFFICFSFDGTPWMTLPVTATSPQQALAIGQGLAEEINRLWFFSWIAPDIPVPQIVTASYGACPIAEVVFLEPNAIGVTTNPMNIDDQTPFQVQWTAVNIGNAASNAFTDRLVITSVPEGCPADPANFHPLIFDSAASGNPADYQEQPIPALSQGNLMQPMVGPFQQGSYLLTVYLAGNMNVYSTDCIGIMASGQ